MKNKLGLGFILVLSMFVSGCGVDNIVARKFGGTSTIELPPNMKLVPYTVQWESENDTVWYLTEPMKDTDVPKTYTFHESSPFGALEGTVIIKESR